MSATDSLTGLLRCPVTNRFMADPITLLPCGHTISKEALAGVSKCPCCDQKVTNHVVVSLISTIAKHVLSQKLPPPPFQIFPFYNQTYSWKERVMTIPGVKKSLNFYASENFDDRSLFYAFLAIGYQDGMIEFTLTSQHHKNSAKDYLIRCGIPKEHPGHGAETSSPYLRYYFVASDLHSKEIMYRIIRPYIPEKFQDLVQDLSLIQDWR